MSLEAWGDEEPGYSAFDAAAEAGWLNPDDQTKALIDVMNERNRQVSEEGWTPEHDDQHVHNEMAKAAACYASFAGLSDYTRSVDLYAPGSIFTAWPWNPSWWKPSDRRRDLVKAAALLIAEIERLDRAEAKKSVDHG